jgi:hypothetical protein
MTFHRTARFVLRFAAACALILSPAMLWGQRDDHHLGYTRTAKCASCHFPRAADADDDTLNLEAGFTTFVTVEQADTWDHEDKHRQSVYLLLAEQNRPLSNRILSFPIEEVVDFRLDQATRRATAVAFKANADPARLADVQKCFACHAPAAEPTGAPGGATTLEFGVSCQACHGPAEKYVAAHADDGSWGWRVLRADIKEKQFGMTDLRDPLKRAGLCASCHVGSPPAAADQPARFIEHRWYASGHPPLPSFEYAAFAAQMPPHWRTLAEKIRESQTSGQAIRFQTGGADPAAISEAFRGNLPARIERELKFGAEAFATSYLEANDASFAKADGRDRAAVVAADLARTKEMLASAAAVLDAHLALSAAQPPVAPRDFSHFDCGACHHELRSDFPSQARVRRGLSPGRPPAPFWTRALAQVAAEEAALRDPAAADLAAKLTTQLAALDAAYSKGPFGDGAAIAIAAADLRPTLQSIGRSIVAVPLDDAAATALVKRLADPRHDEDRDYHAARQLAWALRGVVSDRQKANYRQPWAQSQNRIDELFGATLRLALPAGQRGSVTGELEPALRSISTFEPKEFQKRLQEFRNPEP